MGDAKAVRKLLAYKASAKVRNGLGKTPFFLACEAGNRTIATLLLQADADPNITGE
jgi:ankyrin repeat protein